MDRSKALTWTELRVGLVVIASLAILAATVLYIGGGGGTPWSRKYTIRALMSDVNGLKPGAPVRLGGVEVGTVSRVELAPGEEGMVEVAMKLDRQVQARVTTTSRAALGSLGLLGEKAVDVTAGPGGAPLEDGAYLSATAEDPFKGLMADASDSTAHLKRILARLDAGEGLFGKALRDEELYSRMVDVSVRLQSVLTRLESDRGPLGRLVNDDDMSRRMASSVRSLEAVASRVERGEGTLGTLAQDPEMARELKSLTASLSAVADQLKQGKGTAGHLLQDEALYDKLDRISTRLDQAVTKLDEGQGTAGRLLNDAQLYENLDATARDLRSLIQDVRRDPQKYLRVKVSLF
jgi:phospholipid/cholesterol/gamma-HCH transport system substrate-binding protein